MILNGIKKNNVRKFTIRNKLQVDVPVYCTLSVKIGRVCTSASMCFITAELKS